MPATDATSTGQQRAINGSSRKKGQPKRSCVQRSAVTTEYILTLLGNFTQVQSPVAVRAWIMASSIPTLQSLLVEAVSVHIASDTCIHIKLNHLTVMQYLRTDDLVAELSDALRREHDCRCVLQSDAELVQYRCRATSRHAALDQTRSKHARMMDNSLRWANYYDPLDDDQPCADANDAGVRQQQRCQAAAPQRARVPQRQRKRPAGTTPLIMATWNATSLTPAKTHELLSLASKAHVLIIAVQETWETKDKWKQPKSIASEYTL